MKLTSAAGGDAAAVRYTGIRHDIGVNMFNRELRQAGHVRRFIIRESPGDGWEIREEADSQVVRQVHYRDWHRVERARMRIDEQVSELEERGWR